jgi:hypothetical protein
MNCLKNLAAGGLVLMMGLSAPLAWGQTALSSSCPCNSASDYNKVSSANVSAAQMDEDLSRQIKQAWSEGKNATAAMAFQENGEIAMNEGKETTAKQYFHRAEQELATLQPEPATD